LALTVLLSGLKLSHWRPSEMWTPRSLSGKTLSPGSGFLTPTSRTMAFNLIVSLLGDTAMNWESQIDILPQLISREMDRTRWSTRSSLMDSKRGWMTRKEDGWKSCHMSFGRIEPHLSDQQERLPFQ